MLTSTITAPPGGVDLINGWLKAQKNLTQKDFSSAIKLHPTTVNQMLKGVKDPSPAFLERSAKFTGLDFDVLFAMERQRAEWRDSAEGRAAMAQMEIHAAKEEIAEPFAGRKLVAMLHEADILTFSPFDPDLIGLAGVELTRGSCRLFRDKSIKEISDGDLILRPGESARVKSRERVKLPSDMSMEIGGHGFLLEDAVVVHTSLHLTPPFDDHVCVMIQNLGVADYLLSFGTPCMEGRFFAVSTELTT